MRRQRVLVMNESSGASRDARGPASTGPQRRRSRATHLKSGSRHPASRKMTPPPGHSCGPA
eukprot:2499599-Prymnesium_polylepis.1